MSRRGDRRGQGVIQYKDDILLVQESHCGDKTILRPSYLHSGISFTGKMTSLYWIKAQIADFRDSLRRLIGCFYFLSVG